MSSPLVPRAGAAGPAAKAVKRAEGGVDNWLMGLVTGAGTSPGHIIVSGVLGVVPGLGQAMDARDLILVIIKLAAAPAAPSLWVELVITLVGCIPAIGDGLKVGFKLLKDGRGFGRVMEAGSPMLRGNLHKFFSKIDWKDLATHSKALFAKVIAAFIDCLDSWVVKALTDKRQIDDILAKLRQIQRDAPRMIDQAINELKALHAKMLAHMVPNSTAAKKVVSAKAVPEELAEAAAKANASKVLRNRKGKTGEGVPAPSNVNSNATRKAAQPKKQQWRTGIPAEHIADYFVKHKHTDFTKVNNNGKLTEERCLPHTGLDHLWLDATPVSASKRFIVGETKSSIFDSMLLLAALPVEMQDKFKELKAEESRDRTANDKPNIFHNEGRDALANQSVEVAGDREDAVRKGMNRANPDTALATQMSHAWVIQTMRSEKLIPAGSGIRQLLLDFEDREITCPYHRWILLVTGRQLHQHQRSQGSDHRIQTLLKLPDNILEQ